MEQKLNLFKVACLNYQANPVTYQGKQISRKDLISLQKVVSDMGVALIEQQNKVAVPMEMPLSSRNLRLGRTVNLSPDDNQTTDIMSPKLFETLDPNVMIRAKNPDLDTNEKMLPTYNDSEGAGDDLLRNSTYLTFKGYNRACDLIEEL